MKITSLTELLLLPVLILLLGGCNNKEADREITKFAFFTDIHLNNEPNNCFKGLEMAINSAQEKGAEFIITGGDNTEADKCKTDTLAARSLFMRFWEVINSSALEIKPTMGNHDRFWGIVSEEKPYGEALYEELIAPSYYSFENSGWKFLILNTVQATEGNYFVDSLQIEWIKRELQNTGKEMPIIISVHVPMMSVYSSSTGGRIRPDMFENYSEVKELFREYKLKLVLQGHLHVHEEIMSQGVNYVIGGSVGAAWWGGPYLGTEEGYLLLSLSASDVSWEYIDYGWELKEE